MTDPTNPSFTGINGEQQPNLGQTITTTPSDASIIDALTAPIPTEQIAQPVEQQTVIPQQIDPNVMASPITQPIQPVQPIAQPIQPVQPIAQPIQPVQQVQPIAQPIQPVQQVQPVAEQIQPVLQPGQPVLQPGQPVLQPGQPGQPVQQVQPNVIPQPIQQVQPNVIPQPVTPVQMQQPPLPGTQVPIQDIIQPAQPGQVVAPINLTTAGQAVTPAMNVDPTAAFAPPMAPGQNLICKISPGKFDAFVKILSILNEKNVIIINQSNICQSINNGSAIVTANLSSLIDSQNNAITLHILNPKKYLKYFKNIKGEADIHFIDDTINERYVVTNGDMSIYLPKQIEALESDAAPPDLSSAEPIGQTIEIDKETRATITTMASDSASIDLLIHANQLKGVYIPETAVFSFKDYIKDQIDDTNADLKLRAYSFLQVPGDTYKISIGRIGQTLWSLTFVNTGLVTISVLENLQPVSDDNLII